MVDTPEGRGERGQSSLQVVSTKLELGPGLGSQAEGPRPQAMAGADESLLRVRWLYRAELRLPLRLLDDLPVPSRLRQLLGSDSKTGR